METPSISYTCIVGEGEAAGHLPVPGDVRATFGRARPPVVASVNGHSWRSTVAVMAGETFVPFRRSHRDAAGVGPGDTARVTLTLDTAPRTVEAPDDLLAALDAAGARRMGRAELQPPARMGGSDRRGQEAGDAVEADRDGGDDAGRLIARPRMRHPAEDGSRAGHLDFSARPLHLPPYRGVLQRDRAFGSRLRLGR